MASWYLSKDWFIILKKQYTVPEALFNLDGWWSVKTMPKQNDTIHFQPDVNKIMSISTIDIMKYNDNLCSLSHKDLLTYTKEQQTVNPSSCHFKGLQTFSQFFSCYLTLKVTLNLPTQMRRLHLQYLIMIVATICWWALDICH